MNTFGSVNAWDVNEGSCPSHYHRLYVRTLHGTARCRLGEVFFKRDSKIQSTWIRYLSIYKMINISKQSKTKMLSYSLNFVLKESLMHVNATWRTRSERRWEDVRVAIRTETRPFPTTPSLQNDYCYGYFTSAVMSESGSTWEIHGLKS